METELLEDVGLSLREIRVYEALLELGMSPVGQIIKKSGIPSSKIYETLDKLIKKGLASSIINEGKRHFHASDPKIILEFLEERKNKIKNEVIPKLESLQKSSKKEEEATIYEGIRGIKSIYEKMLRVIKKDDTIMVMGASLIGQEKIELYLQNWNMRRLKLGIKMQIIYHPEAKKYGEIREKMKLTEVKYLKENIVTPAWVDVFQNFVVTFDFSKEMPSAFLIKSKSISESYKNYFNQLWKIAKK